MELVLPQFGLFFWSAIIFLIFLWLLSKYAWKPLLSALDARERRIAEALSAAEQARAEMEALRIQQEKLQMEAAREREELLAKAQKVRDEIIESARQEAQKQAATILQMAHQQIQQQRDRLMMEMRQYAVNLSLQIARHILEEHFRDEEKARAYAEKLATEIRLN
ncbi:MAG: F0F1 ATP synthase subunit B [Bacteroidia bacterium]|nr:F0F1 ATP synthase subunit B [Bacteroidia bacterium]MDW8015025.1 F0F1 ATP synthase subunit B [Bacteroidia bacterium]